MSELWLLPNLVIPKDNESAASLTVRLADANHHESHTLIQNAVREPLESSRRGRFCANVISDPELSSSFPCCPA